MIRRPPISTLCPYKPLFRSSVNTLIPGNYRLTVEATGGAPGAYSFRLLDFAAATPITLDAQQTQTITPGIATRVVTFTGTKDQVVYLDSISRSGYINSNPTS